jgi:hypothetical protein
MSDSNDGNEPPKYRTIRTISQSTDISYDASVIRSAASALYAQAEKTVAFWVTSGLFLGLFTSWVTNRFRLKMEMESFTFCMAGVVIGLFIGKQKALWIKLEAQRALCLAKIEENTRSSNNESD